MKKFQDWYFFRDLARRSKAHEKTVTGFTEGQTCTDIDVSVVTEGAASRGVSGEERRTGQLIVKFTFCQIHIENIV